jgi:hypothetical protein
MSEELLPLEREGYNNLVVELHDTIARLRAEDGRVTELAERIHMAWLRCLGPNQCWWWSSMYHPEHEDKEELHKLILELRGLL